MEEYYPFTVDAQPWITPSNDSNYEPYNKDAVLFPETINDDYVMINLSGGMGGQMGAIWITYSKDLVHWGRAKAIMGPEPGWGASKLGISMPPLKTDRGWFMLYHGVRETASGRL